jgi:hypothetical protein
MNTIYPPVAMMSIEMALGEHVQNMEPNIPNNRNERILNYIMCDCALSPMNTTK